MVSELKIIKPYKEGTGILIEQDAGFIDPNYPKNLEMLKEFDEKVKSSYSSNSFLDIKEPLILYAVLQKYGVENQNGRIYPEQVLRRENEKYQSAIKMRAAYGENNHADSSVIDSERLALNIIETWWEDHTLMGKMEILTSPGFIRDGHISCQGDFIANWIRWKLTIGISSRGIGSVKKINGKTIVQDDFELICWDAVTTPSTPGSFLLTDKNAMQQFKENKEYQDNNIMLERINSLKKLNNKFFL